MANVIIVLILVAICAYGIKSYMKNVSHGCCGTGGDEEKKIRVQDKHAEHYPYCVKVGVDGMTCSHCKLRVENALNEKEGVWAQVDLKDKSATVRMKQSLSEDEIRTSISRAGYTVTDYQEA